MTIAKNCFIDDSSENNSQSSMMKSSISRSLPPHERGIWQGYPSWPDHAVLFLFMGIAGLRTVLAVRAGEWMTAGLYLATIGIFLGIAAAFRYASLYQITSHRIRVISGLGSRRSEE